jgi:hypothetical protein
MKHDGSVLTATFAPPSVLALASPTALVQPSVWHSFRSESAPGRYWYSHFGGNKIGEEQGDIGEGAGGGKV